MVTRPYGSWTSPITSDLVVAEAIRLEQVALDGDTIYWTESQPQKQGRCFVYRASPGGEPEAVTPDDDNAYNVRTRVHEYGGGAFVVQDGTVYFSNFADQRLYRQDAGHAPRPLTPVAAPAGALRYADGVIDRRLGRLICVHEDHTRSGQPINTLASVDLAGAQAARVPRLGQRLLLDAANQPGWHAPGLAHLESSRHALGRGRGVGRRGPGRWHGRPSAPGRGRAGRSGVPAAMVARWRALFRVGPRQRLVEPLSRARRRDRAAGAHGGRVRAGAVELRDVDLRLRRGGAHRLLLYPGRRLAPDPARPQDQALRCDGSALHEPRAAPRRRGTGRVPGRLAFRTVHPGRARSRHRRSADHPALGRPRRRGAALCFRRAADRLPDRGRRDRPRALLPAALARLHRAGRRESAGAGQEPWRPDRVGLEHAVARGAVLDQPRHRRARRELPRQHGIRPSLSAAARAAMGPPRCRGLRPRRAPSGRGRGRRSRAPDDQRRQRRRLHDALRADGSRREDFQRRRQLLRRERPGGPGARHPQVRIALPRLAHRTVSAGPADLCRALAASTTSIASPCR